MALTLRVTSYRNAPPDLPVVCRFDQRGGDIGRAPECTLALPDPAKYISRRHASIECHDGAYFYVEAGANPGLINDRPVVTGQRVALADGDTLVLGEYVIAVSIPATLPPAFDQPAAIAAGPAMHGPAPVFDDLAAIDLLGVGSEPRRPAPSPAAQGVAPDAAQQILDDFLGRPLPVRRPGTPAWRGSEADHHPHINEPWTSPPAHDASPPPPRAAPPATRQLIPDDIDFLADEALPLPSAEPRRDAAPPAMLTARLPDDLLAAPAAARRPDELLAGPIPARLPDEPPAAPIPARLPDEPLAAPIPARLPDEPLVAPIPARLPDEPLAAPGRARLPDKPLVAPQAARPKDAPGGAQLPKDRPQPAPQAPAAAATAAPLPITSAAAAPSVDLHQALLAGLGAEHWAPAAGNEAAFAQAVGALLRDVLAGTMAVLRARAEAKSGFVIEPTLLGQRDNNPLKFFPNVDMALEQMLLGRRPGYLPTDAAVREAFGDIQVHEMATLAGMRGACEALVAQFDPARLERAAGDAGSLLAALPGQRKARLWDALAELHGQLARPSGDAFQRVVSEAFARAYRDQLAAVEPPERGS